MTTDTEATRSLHQEILELERRLSEAKLELGPNQAIDPEPSPEIPLKTTPSLDKNHFWLILSDSALPLGSFAFSSGLESYIAHRPASFLRVQDPTSKLPTPRHEIERFLRLSLYSVASTTLPFVVAAHKDPALATELDDEFDASTTCNVARRASIAQGRALITVWEKAFSSTLPNTTEGLQDIEKYRKAMRRGPAEEDAASGHFGVAWGAICRVAGLDLEQSCYIFLFNHAKAVLSAAVRQGLIGPYNSQSILATESTQKNIRASLEFGTKLSIEKAGQTVPTFDIYQGRHELLYSRVFNS
ncbi:hypothetical protein RUND412_004191 [Rhizina undulata]